MTTQDEIDIADRDRFYARLDIAHHISEIVLNFVASALAISLVAALYHVVPIMIQPF